MRPLEERAQHTTHSCYTWFSAAQYMKLCQLKAPFSLKTLRPNSNIRQRLIHSPLTKYHPMSSNITVHCMEQSWYVQLSLLVTKTWQTLVQGIPITREHCLMDFFGYSVNTRKHCCNTFSLLAETVRTMQNVSMGDLGITPWHILHCSVCLAFVT